MTAPPGTPNTRGGALTLALAPLPGRTVATTVRHQGALRTLRPHYGDDTGAMTWTIINPGGGYLADDCYELTLDLAAGAHAILIGQSATKIYRCPGDSEVRQSAVVRLGPGAALDWRAEPLIAYAGSRYRQHTVVTRDPAATVVLSEVITPGWAPDGAAFGWSRVQLLTEIRSPTGTLEFVDNLLIEPQHDDPADDALTAGFSHLGSLIALDARIDTELVDEIETTLMAGVREEEARVGFALVPGPGLVLRVLATSSERARGVVDAVADGLAERWFGRAQLDRHQW